MKSICYECNKPGIIIPNECDFTSQFAVVKKYELLYTEALPRFQKLPSNIYGLPYHSKPQQIYNGTDRTEPGLAYKLRNDLTGEERVLADKLIDDCFFANEWMQIESSALKFMSLLKESENYELIWLRNSGLRDPIPNGYEFIGYDISYPCDYDGSFSIICDCMFICRWHGCDKEGTLFTSDFHKLNANGLFNTWQDAYVYMEKYLNEDWTERGEYCILEVYQKRASANT